ncbi:hypothetical protein [Nonomuraea typhae]|uniref:Uncharacterized protein n=1 Tax=Nonomuraea typhae TaxID=2603600 RepID=A0ABW7YS92_9ACTN
MTTTSHAFWADGNCARYGAYVRQREHLFAEMWRDDPTAEFAALAWRIARSPIMAPPYLRSHGRVLTAELHVSRSDGALIAVVELATSQPEALRRLLCDEEGRWWSDWPSDSWTGRLYEPEVTEEDLVHRSYLLTSAKAVFTVATTSLPAVAGSPLQLEDLARNSVAELVRLVNRVVDPLLDAIENGRSSR